jgi:hypothetical protein
MEEGEINRRADLAAQSSDEANASAREQERIQEAAARDPMRAQAQEIERLQREAAKQREHAEGTSNVEQKRGFENAAIEKEIQLDAERFKLVEMQRAKEESLVDSIRAAEHAQVDLLSVTGKEVEARARIHLLQEQIADNARRMDYATPEQKAQLQAVNTGLQEQITKLRTMEAMKTPSTKRADRASSRAAIRAGNADMTRQWDAFNTEQHGGKRVRLGDHLMPKMAEPKPGIGIAAGIDASQTGKAIEQIKNALTGKRKFG